jgi:hypothetical protein
MLTPPIRIIHNADVLPALRELFGQHPTMTQSGPESLSRALYVFRFPPHRPPTFEVEAALEALRIEGEVVP